VGLSAVKNFVVNPGCRVLSECKGGAIQTALATATLSAGMIVRWIGRAAGPKGYPRSSQIVGVALSLCAFHPYTRIFGAVVAVSLTAAAGAVKVPLIKGAILQTNTSNRLPDNLKPASEMAVAFMFRSTIYGLITPITVTLALGIRAYMVKV